MGPITLFDKSFLQSLSVDESVWFDHFFYPIICPLFYVETLADLEKAVREGRTPEQEVGLIAEKTPEMHGGPSVHHGDLCIANLMGHPIPMKNEQGLVSTFDNCNSKTDNHLCDTLFKLLVIFGSTS